MSNRAGHYETQGVGELAYKAFVPAPLPPSPPIEIDEELGALLADASRQLAVLETLSAKIPGMGLFVSMYVRKEALMSSQIEGTQATLEDILDPLIEDNANRDAAEVVNYVKAAEFAIKRLEELPLCSRLLRETHAVLMSGVRGGEVCPGEFRRSQNWIGGAGSTIKTAAYIPPAPNDMEEAMGSLEKYMNAQDGAAPLVRAALIHYQFETIHPFLDGNGRIGRLLITLYLMEEKALSSPALYISYFLKKNRVEYYDRMTEVRKKGNYEQWVKFFLRAALESAKDAATAIGKLALLHEKNARAVSSMGRAAKNAMRVFCYLEANPIIDIGKTADALGLSFNTVASAVRRLMDAGILAPAKRAERGRTFAYEEYLAILRRGTDV